MQPLEITATNADEARAKAAKAFGVPPERVKVTVLEEKQGLFGRGSVLARAELEPEPAAAPVPKPPLAEPHTNEPAILEADAATQEEASAPAAEVEGQAKRARRRLKPEEASDQAEPVEETMETPQADHSAEVAEAPVQAETSPDEAVGEEEESGDTAVATQEDADQLIGYMDQIFESGGLRASMVLVSITGKYINLKVDGPDVRYLVGKRGEVLNALQYLMNVIASRKIESGARVVLDGDDYRARREAVLSNYAHEIAQQVKERGEEAVLDALPAFERRLVHKALEGVEGVTTYSEGEEPNRCVVIAPSE